MRNSYYYIFIFLMTAFVFEFSLGWRLSQIEGLSFKNLAMLMLMFYWVVNNSIRGKPLLQSGPVTVPSILFVIYCTLSLIGAWLFQVVPGYSIIKELLFFKSTMDPYLLLLIIYSMTHDVATARKLLFVLVGVMAVFLAITLLGSFNLVQIERVYINEKLGRTRGAFSEWNQFSLYLVTFIPLTGAFFYNARSKMMKTFLVVALLLAGYVILLTSSRGALVSLAASIGAFYLLYSRKPIISRVFTLVGVYVVSIAMLVILALLLPETSSIGLINKLTGNFKIGSHGQATDYSSGRIGLWTSSIGYLFSHPYKLFIGTGWRTFIPLFGGNSHNDYLLYFVTTGIIGLSLYLWVFIRLIKSVFQYRKKDRQNLHFYNAYLSSMAGYFTGMLFVNIFNPAYYVLIYSALILKLGEVASQKLVSKPLKSDRGVIKNDRIISRKSPVKS